MPQPRLPQDLPGCRTILVRLIFRTEKGSTYRSVLARKPLRLIITFTRTKKHYEWEPGIVDKKE